MGTIHLYHDTKLHTTAVPNAFIDHYMTQADGEYIKIFLYLLRCMNQSPAGFSVSRAADHFDHTEKDILRALKYWERKKLLALDYDERKNLCGIQVLTETLFAESEEERGTDDTVSVTSAFIQAAEPDPKEYTPDQLEKFCENADIQEMVFIAERYIGRSLNQTDLNHIFSWYDQLGFPADLIVYLIEYCVSKGHTSVRYMQKIAEDLASRDIKTTEDAKLLLGQGTELYYTVMKSFGIRGRNLVPSETDYINRWRFQLGFSCDMIGEACSRTIERIHEPSFAYADSILLNWKKNKINTLADVKQADSAYSSERSSRRSAQAYAAASNSTRFSNFRQRENNYDDLQRQLIRQSMQ